MIFATIITVPLEAISVGLNREATLFVNELTKSNGCLSIVPDDIFNAGPVFYLARLYVLSPRRCSFSRCAAVVLMYPPSVSPFSI
jgi:hypothetical protein